VDDYIIDTNVLLVASASDPNSRFQDCDHISPEQQEIVLNWLMEFRKDKQRKVVLDHAFKIWDEYHNKMVRGQDLGSLVVAEKLQSALVRVIEIAYNEDGHGCLPPELEKVIHDRSDRKFVAVALLDISLGNKSTIINAVDTDWCEWEKALNVVGINVKHIIDDLCEDKVTISGRGRRRSRPKR
jgi:hypothetical protein